MYQPSKPGFRVEDLVLEENLNYPILQLLLGAFIPSTDIFGVAVLHPKRLVVYEIIPQGSLGRNQTLKVLFSLFKYNRLERWAC